MAKLRLSVVPVLLLVALQAGCTTMPTSMPVDEFSSVELPSLACDTAAKQIPLATRLRNDTGGDIIFNLEGDRGPPYNPWYLGYRVYSSLPGGPYELVHNSGHDSVWNRIVVTSPGESVDLNVPLFGLRPADYKRWFRIELRDSENRSYWTAPFALCSIQRPLCGCPPSGGVAVGLQGPPQSCAATTAGDRCQ